MLHKTKKKQQQKLQILDFHINQVKQIKIKEESNRRRSRLLSKSMEIMVCRYCNRFGAGAAAADTAAGRC
jgi:hypothetical protein